MNRNGIAIRDLTVSEAPSNLSERKKTDKVYVDRVLIVRELY